jgi:hypothetical protein
VSTEHEECHESDDHQEDVVELPRAVGTPIEDNRATRTSTQPASARLVSIRSMPETRRNGLRRLVAGLHATITRLDPSSVNAHILPRRGCYGHAASR